MKGWRQLEREIKRGRSDPRGLVVGLDFDGTLAPLAPHPSLARLPAKTRRLLARLARRPRVRLAIVSGRGLADVRRLVGLKGVHYAGNHGLQILGPGFCWRHPRTRAAAADVRALARRLERPLRDFPRTHVENKGPTLSVHYRGMAPRLEPALHAAVTRALRPFARSLRLAAGKKTWEARPKARWNKGHALLKIARLARPGGRLLFVGDDRTDEEGFLALGRRAVTVRVGPASRTAARFLLKGRRDVDCLLQFLCRLPWPSLSPRSRSASSPGSA
ncbi:MAG: trehalose-phosphatase [Elusimicrobia bacterium]|nr:trehalose-phosphatase [Elusimicrobiota bacterium]